MVNFEKVQIIKNNKPGYFTITEENGNVFKYHGVTWDVKKRIVKGKLTLPGENKIKFKIKLIPDGGMKVKFTGEFPTNPSDIYQDITGFITQIIKNDLVEIL